MTWVNTLSDITDGIFDTPFDDRDGRVIPDTDDIAIKDGAVHLTATFMYADLAGTSRLTRLCPWQTTAKIIRAYLACATRLIRAYEGEIKSFDGDRVMGVFIGDLKNTHATNCAREIDYTIEKIIGPKAEAKFKSIRENSIKLRHGIGIDTGGSTAVRAGIRDNSDLIWIGRPPSLAAKLSDIRDYPHTIYISNDVFNKLPKSSKETDDGTKIWEKAEFVFADKKIEVRKTSRMRTP